MMIGVTARIRSPLTIASAMVTATGGLTLSACGSSGDDGGGATQVVELDAVEYEFRARDAIAIEAGDTVEFRVRNAGEIDHELEVLTSENRSLGTTERISPGATRSVTVTFSEAGLYQVICDIDDHRSRGQNPQFEVIDGG